METRDIDALLQRYTASEHRIGSNLQELEQHSVYQLLTTDVLSGETAKAFAPVTDADPGLWELYSLLSSKLDVARALRGTDKRFSYDDRMKIAEILTQRSITLHRTDIPLAERGLTGQAISEESLSIEELIQRMSDVYEPVRDAVTQAETVLRSVLPRLASAETTLARLRDQAQALRMQAPELDRIEETIARVRDLSLTDPIAIPLTTKASLDEALHDAAAMIASSRTSHDELAGDITRASDLLDECRELIARAEQNRAETQAKIAHPVGLRQPPSLAAIDGERGLANKLAPILASTQSWQIVRRQLDGWMNTTERLRDCLLYTSPSPRDATLSRMPSSA